MGPSCLRAFFFDGLAPLTAGCSPVAGFLGGGSVENENDLQMRPSRGY